mmetsp:Transcript_31059/g.102443  ORF Transcript_31059/g.102443 Transcript_31059/m.102443 type:complete len:336 (-) Transcript_31059:25-1032(-)
MRCRLLVLVALAQARPQQYDPEGGRGPSRPAVAGVPGAAPRATGPPLSRQPGQPGQIGRAVQRYQSFVNGAAKVSRWIHVGCGFWVIVSTPVSLISSGVSLRPAEMMLCGYLGLFGFVLAGCELPLARGLFETYCRFLYTTQGRLLFMAHVAVVAWSCKYVGILTKTLLLFNALISAYVYNSKALHHFGVADERAQGEVGDAVNRAKEALGEVSSMSRLLGVGKIFGLGSKPPAPPPPPPSAYRDSDYGGTGGGGYGDGGYGDGGGGYGGGGAGGGGGGCCLSVCGENRASLNSALVSAPVARGPSLRATTNDGHMFSRFVCVESPLRWTRVIED